MTGQQYDAQARPRMLHFSPDRALLGTDFLTTLADSGSNAQSAQWPAVLPHASAVVRLHFTNGQLCAEFNVLSGGLDLRPEYTKFTDIS